MRRLSCALLGAALLGALLTLPAAAGPPVVQGGRGRTGRPVREFMTHVPVKHPAWERTVPTSRLTGRKYAEGEVEAVVGQAQVPVLLTEFTDNAADSEAHPPSVFQQLLFGKDSPLGAGSLRDYYRDMSGGLFDFSGQVSSWMTMPRPYQEYVGSRNGRQFEETNARTLIRDAVEAADPEMDYCDFDRDGDGLVDAVVLVHAGTAAEETRTSDALWSHQSRLVTPFQTGDVCDGQPVSVSYYMVQPEKHWNDTYVAPGVPADLISIGVFAHEFGHILGLPDLYDRDYDTYGGVGTWDLMAQGAWGFNGKPWRPAPMSAWTRAELGWVVPQRVLTDTKDVSFTPVDRMADGPAGRVHALYPEGDPTSPEYLLLEFRSPSWVWAEGFPSGVAIWHVNEAQREHGNDDQDARLLELVQADGLDELGVSVDSGSPWGDAGDLFPGSSDRIYLDASGQPQVPLQTNAGSPLAVRNITIKGSRATADLVVFGRDDPPEPPRQPTEPRSRVAPDAVASRLQARPVGRASALEARGGGVVHFAATELPRGTYGVAYDLEFQVPDADISRPDFELTAQSAASGRLSLYDWATGTYVPFGGFLVRARGGSVRVALPDLARFVDADGRLLVGISRSARTSFAHVIDRAVISFDS
ncbi:MAG: M6 family metalloprotease domain-containing protein [Actinobacteria bacterium]|nr:M6 family metalloprotease domain-containing protein [Actinomycetota bacterium]